MPYDEQHCDIHNQDYAKYLHGCPICVGEKMSGKGYQINAIREPKLPEEEDEGMVLDEHGYVEEEKPAYRNFF